MRKLFASAIFLFVSIGILRAQDPTPQQIVSGWAAFSGNKAGKVVYGLNNKVMVLDLKTGLANAVADFPIANIFGVGNASYRFSPSGTRIACQNDKTLIVMNADGSNQKTIWQGSIGWDLIVADWDGDSAVAYSTFDKVVETAVHADNSAGATQVLVPGPAAGGIGFCSVCRSGDYICYIDIRANCGGACHRPIVRNVKTNAFIETVDRNNDACQLRLKPDGSGTSIYDPNYHTNPAQIKNFSNVLIDSLPIAPGMYSNLGYRWTYDTKFIIHLNEAGAVYIRNMTTANKDYFFLASGNMAWPDLWEGDAIVSGQVGQPQITPGDSLFSDSVAVTLTTSTSGASIYYTLNGGTPSNGSTLYNASFTLKTSATIKAIAYKSGMTASLVTSRSYVSVAMRTPENPTLTKPGLDYRYDAGSWSEIG
ncbi:MAG: chitobiase/beta-hexosaminidase C-terminal domain-containing protein, partial [Chitinivibrionales bacterium]|nr:chitobiase/beta-hexosaminidase C-terminal domain-containing protein [Chitinivibrionales bacterium]